MVFKHLTLYSATYSKEKENALTLRRLRTKNKPRKMDYNINNICCLAIYKYFLTQYDLSTCM